MTYWLLGGLYLLGGLVIYTPVLMGLLEENPQESDILTALLITTAWPVWLPCWLLWLPCWLLWQLFLLHYRWTLRRLEQRQLRQLAAREQANRQADLAAAARRELGS
jgi:hypothetical protein